MTVPTRAVQKEARSAARSRAAGMFGGTSAVQAIAVATEAKGVASGRVATERQSRSAHC